MATTGKPAQEGAERLAGGLAQHDSPIDFLAAEHTRARSLCSMIDTVAEAATPDKVAMTRVLDYLETDLPAHIHAEVDYFFPVLRLHCPMEDEIGPAIEAVADEHEATIKILPGLACVLRQHLVDGLACTEVERDQLHDLAAHVRRHVVLTNAILMPIAKVRLSEADLLSLRTSMLAGQKSLFAGGDHTG